MSRIDSVTLTLVIAVMALKPTADDVVLAAMAIVSVAGAALVFTRASSAVAAPAAD